MTSFCRAMESTIPDFVVLSCGLWHMLHITDALDFQEEMQSLKAAAKALSHEKVMLA